MGCCLPGRFGFSTPNHNPGYGFNNYAGSTDGIFGAGGYGHHGEFGHHGGGSHHHGVKGLY